MSKKKRRQRRDGFADIPVPNVQPRSVVGYILSNDVDRVCASDYTSLDKCPEIVAGVQRIAELIGSMTIHLMMNTDKGDARIQNELSRTIDIDPMPNMTRSNWMTFIVMNLLLYGKGNAIVLPHTWEGYIQSLEPVAADRVQLLPRGDSRRYYDVYVDGIKRDPGNLIHCVYNPDKTFPWKGAGIDVQLRDIAKTLKQARTTENAFMESKWKPSIIVKVDALADEFSTKAGRKKLLEEYVEGSEAGEPWLIPAESFDVQSIKPLTLSDLALKDFVELDKKTVATILGIPSFILGVGEFKRDEWNNFISSTIMPLAQIIEQELTKKLVTDPNLFFRFNSRSLLNYSMDELIKAGSEMVDRMAMRRNEWRDWMGLEYDPEMEELLALENYIPADRLGDQSKLTGGET